MPNKVFIQSLYRPSGQEETEADDVMVFPLQEDIRIMANSDISSWSDMIPGLDRIMSLMTLQTATGGISEGLLDFANMADAPRWQKTNPLEIVLNLGFYLIDNPLENIYRPMKKLIGLSILTRDPNNEKRFIPPGLFLPAASKATASENESDKAEASSSAKLIAIKIPGVLFMNLAMIKQAVPTFSQHITRSGYPLWGSLELTIVGLYPAFEDNFNAENELGDPDRSSFFGFI